MISKNLKYYRLKKGFSKKELASLSNVSSMAIGHYESGSRRPSMATLNLIAKALDVRVSDFLVIRNENLQFSHGEFRKNQTLNKTQQEYIRESVEEYFSRFYTSVELLGGDVLPPFPECHSIVPTSDHEKNAEQLRRHLKLSIEGPVDDLIGMLENKGILILGLDVENDKFSGMNGLVNGRPYIVYNKNMTTERNRSTIAHELAHLMFRWPDSLPNHEEEQYATAISGAFLFPLKDVIRELGIRRKSVTSDMFIVCKEFGISMYMLVKRAEIAKVLSGEAARAFYISAAQMGWRKNEPTRIDHIEVPMLFAQLVYRAINEEGISIQRGSELLKVPFADVLKHSLICGG